MHWIGLHVTQVGPAEIMHRRPWATVLRVPLAGGIAWFKACAPVQAFEPRLTAALSARWPDRVSEVIAYSEPRGWLLLADAGRSVGDVGNPPEAWLAALPRYADLQRGEAAHAQEHLAHGVPDLRLATLPAHYDELLRLDLPIDPEEVQQLRRFAPRFAELCDALAAYDLPATIQHDDLHHANLYAQDDNQLGDSQVANLIDRGGRRSHGAQHLRVLDWGDASIAHPFASLVVTFRFLEECTGLAPTDPWFARLRDAYLEPWGHDLAPACTLAIRVGTFARAIAYIRVRAVLTPEERRHFDADFAITLRRAVAQTG